MMKEDKDFIVPLSLLNQIAQYLSARPYVEVVSMMQALANGNIVRAVEEKVEDKKEDVAEDGSSN